MCSGRYNAAMSHSPTWRTWVAALAVAALAFIGGLALSHYQSGRSVGVDGLLWPDPPRIDDVDLLTTDGRPFTADALRGRWSLLFFGFTHCPDVCPLTLDVLARAHRALKSNAHYGARGQVVFVSVDPERDTPAVLADYVRHFDPEFVAVTAPVAALGAFTRRLGVLFAKVEQGGGDYSVDHSAGIFFIDPELRLVSVLTPPHDLAAVLERYARVSEFIEARL